MSLCDPLLAGASAGVAPALRAVDCLANETTASAFGRLFGGNGALVPALTILLTLYIFIGLFGHDPWKNDDAITIGIAHDMLAGGNWLMPHLAGQPYPDAPFYYWAAAAFGQLFSWLLPEHGAARLASGLFTLLALATSFARYSVISAFAWSCSSSCFFFASRSCVATPHWKFIASSAYHSGCSSVAFFQRCIRTRQDHINFGFIAG